MTDSNRREQQAQEAGTRVNDRRRIRLDEQGNPVLAEEPGAERAAAEGGPSEPRASTEQRASQAGATQAGASESGASSDQRVAGADEGRATPRETAEGGAGEALESPEVLQLKRDLETARRRVDELARAYQALDKDREEFKQRLQRERDRMLEVEKGNAASMVLEAIDELDRSLGASASGQDTSPLAQGIRLIRDGLLQKVQAQGVQRLEVVGKPYDPNTAEAYDMEITPNEDEDQMVLEEARAGYRYKDRVLRPARVKVAKYVKPAQA